MTKIENFISDVFRIFENLGKNEYYIKKTIKSCKTYEQCQSCLNLIESLERFTKAEINLLLKKNRLVNIITFGKLGKSLGNYVEKRIRGIKYYRIVFLSKLKKYNNDNRGIKE
jgi:TnpA family transposase